MLVKLTEKYCDYGRNVVSFTMIVNSKRRLHTVTSFVLSQIQFEEGFLMKMKKVLCTAISFVMLLSMFALPASASEVKKPTEEEMKEIFSDIGFATTMVGNFWATDSLGGNPEKVPDETAFWYLSQSGALKKYYIEDEMGDGWYKLKYDEYIALVDAAFTNHSDMKQYLTDREFYDASTDSVNIYIGGFGGPSDWVMTSTYETKDSIYLQGLYLEEPVEDENLIEFFNWHYTNNGDKFLIKCPMIVKLDKTDSGWKIDMCREFSWYICEEKNLLLEADGGTFIPYAPITLNIEKGATVTMNDEPFEYNITGFLYNNTRWYLYGQGFFLNVSVADTHELTGVYIEDADGKKALEYVAELGQYCGFPEVGKPLTLHVETKPIVTASTPNVKLESSSNVSIIAPADSTDHYENLKLVVNEIKTDDSDYTVITTVLGDSYKKILPLDISLEDYKGDKTQPNGKITVSVPIPESWDADNIEVIYVADDGTKTLMSSQPSADGKYILFETDHFSSYVLAEAKQTNTKQESTTSPQTGDNSNMILWISLLIVSAFGLAGTSVLGKKKTIR